MEQENLIEIMPNTYICKTQAGWRKLLKKLYCYGDKPYNSMEVCYQPAIEGNAFEMANVHGTDRKVLKQYPIKYPALVSFQDDSFEMSQFCMYIIYISQETCDSIIKDAEIPNCIGFKEGVPDFRLPTKEEFENLNKHFSRWNEEKKSFEVLNDSLSVLELPVTGYRDYDNVLRDSEDICYYWSSTVCDFDVESAYYFYCNFCSHAVNYGFISDKQPIRLVSDEPFEGGVEFDGVWWKPENEDGYYSYEEAMNKFNNK